MTPNDRFDAIAQLALMVLLVMAGVALIGLVRLLAYGEQLGGFAAITGTVGVLAFGAGVTLGWAAHAAAAEATSDDPG